MLCSNKFEDNNFDYQDPWSQVLANCAWAIRSTVHNILNSMPAQIVFDETCFLIYRLPLSIKK
jgi:hypothetical protein